MERQPPDGARLLTNLGTSRWPEQGDIDAFRIYVHLREARLADDFTVFDRFLSLGWLSVDASAYNGVAVTEAGRRVLK